MSARRTSRRTVLQQAAALLVWGSSVRHARAYVEEGSPAAGAAESFEALERKSGGRLGLAVLDTGSGRRIGLRMDERFPLCSTFKPLAVAAVLARVDRGQEQLARSIRYGAADLLEYAPVTSAHLGEGQLSVAALCEAAVTLSDNTAANLLLESLGGPAALTAYLRSLGDGTTRLDRTEPSLNEALPGDERDTTTPLAMALTLQKLLVGGALSRASRERLCQWLSSSVTGRERLRAGVPSTWRVGDKTGSGHHGTTNDVAILWPPDRKPILIAGYLTETTADATVRNGVFAEVARIVATGSI
jgi:beta-lactamase class A